MPPDFPTVLILASGRGERFKASGGMVHKLQALLAGKPVLQRTLDTVRASGLPWHLEDAGHPGMGDSIAAAVRATAGAPGWLVLPGDLPSVKADASGVAAIHFESRTIRVGGSANDIVGKGLFVHRDPDDFKTQPTGNAGPRLACAVITAK